MHWRQSVLDLCGEDGYLVASGQVQRFSHCWGRDKSHSQKGGTILEVGADGTEHRWGTFLTFNPSTDLSMDFHITTPGENESGQSRVEMTFADLGDGRTRADLTQSNWDAFGDKALGLRAGYKGSWTAILNGAFKAACGG